MTLNSLMKTTVLAVAVLTISSTSFAQFRGGPRGPGHGDRGPGPGPAPMPRANDTLFINQQLFTNDSISSQRGSLQLIMQSDCNLVLYAITRSGQQAALFSTHTNKKGEYNCRAIMQGDGNFVVYGGSGRALWASNTVGTRADAVVVTDQGGLQLFSGPRVIWTAPNRP